MTLTRGPMAFSLLVLLVLYKGATYNPNEHDFQWTTGLLKIPDAQIISPAYVTPINGNVFSIPPDDLWPPLLLGIGLICSLIFDRKTIFFTAMALSLSVAYVGKKDRVSFTYYQNPNLHDFFNLNTILFTLYIVYRSFCFLIGVRVRSEQKEEQKKTMKAFLNRAYSKEPLHTRQAYNYVEDVFSYAEEEANKSLWQRLTTTDNSHRLAQALFFVSKRSNVRKGDAVKIIGKLRIPQDAKNKYCLLLTRPSSIKLRNKSWSVQLDNPYWTPKKTSCRKTVKAAIQHREKYEKPLNIARPIHLVRAICLYIVSLSSHPIACISHFISALGAKITSPVIQKHGKISQGKARYGPKSHPKLWKNGKRLDIKQPKTYATQSVHYSNSMRTLEQVTGLYLSFFAIQHQLCDGELSNIIDYLQLAITIFGVFGHSVVPCDIIASKIGVFLLFASLINPVSALPYGSDVYICIPIVLSALSIFVMLCTCIREKRRRLREKKVGSESNLSSEILPLISCPPMLGLQNPDIYVLFDDGTKVIVQTEDEVRTFDISHTKCGGIAFTGVRCMEAEIKSDLYGLYPPLIRAEKCSLWNTDPGRRLPSKYIIQSSNYTSDGVDLCIRGTGIKDHFIITQKTQNSFTLSRKPLVRESAVDCEGVDVGVCAYCQKREECEFSDLFGPCEIPTLFRDSVLTEIQDRPQPPRASPSFFSKGNKTFMSLFLMLISLPGGLCDVGSMDNTHFMIYLFLGCFALILVGLVINWLCNRCCYSCCPSENYVLPANHPYHASNRQERLSREIRGYIPSYGSTRVTPDTVYTAAPRSNPNTAAPRSNPFVTYDSPPCSVNAQQQTDEVSADILEPPPGYETIADVPSIEVTPPHRGPPVMTAIDLLRLLAAVGEHCPHHSIDHDEHHSHEHAEHCLHHESFGPDYSVESEYWEEKEDSDNEYAESNHSDSDGSVCTYYEADGNIENLSGSAAGNISVKDNVPESITNRKPSVNAGASLLVATMLPGAVDAHGGVVCVPCGLMALFIAIAFYTITRILYKICKKLRHRKYIMKCQVSEDFSVVVKADRVFDAKEFSRFNGSEIYVEDIRPFHSGVQQKKVHVKPPSPGICIIALALIFLCCLTVPCSANVDQVHSFQVKFVPAAEQETVGENAVAIVFKNISGILATVFDFLTHTWIKILLNLATQAFCIYLTILVFKELCSRVAYRVPTPFFQLIGLLRYFPGRWRHEVRARDRRGVLAFTRVDGQFDIYKEVTSSINSASCKLCSHCQMVGHYHTNCFLYKKATDASHPVAALKNYDYSTSALYHIYVKSSHIREVKALLDAEEKSVAEADMLQNGEGIHLQGKSTLGAEEPISLRQFRVTASNGRVRTVISNEQERSKNPAKSPPQDTQFIHKTEDNAFEEMNVVSELLGIATPGYKEELARLLHQAYPHRNADVFVTEANDEVGFINVLNRKPSQRHFYIVTNHNVGARHYELFPRYAPNADSITITRVGNVSGNIFDCHHVVPMLEQDGEAEIEALGVSYMRERVLYEGKIYHGIDNATVYFIRHQNFQLTYAGHVITVRVANREYNCRFRDGDDVLRHSVEELPDHPINKIVVPYINEVDVTPVLDENVYPEEDGDDDDGDGTVGENPGPQASTDRAPTAPADAATQNASTTNHPPPAPVDIDSDDDEPIVVDDDDEIDPVIRRAQSADDFSAYERRREMGIVCGDVLPPEIVAVPGVVDRIKSFFQSETVPFRPLISSTRRIGEEISYSTLPSAASDLTVDAPVEPSRKFSLFKFTIGTGADGTFGLIFNHRYNSKGTNSHFITNVSSIYCAINGQLVPGDHLFSIDGVVVEGMSSAELFNHFQRKNRCVVVVKRYDDLVVDGDGNVDIYASFVDELFDKIAQTHEHLANLKGAHDRGFVEIMACPIHTRPKRMKTLTDTYNRVYNESNTYIANLTALTEMLLEETNFIPLPGLDSDDISHIPAPFAEEAIEVFEDLPPPPEEMMSYVSIGLDEAVGGVDSEPEGLVVTQNPNQDPETNAMDMTSASLPAQTQLPISTDIPTPPRDDAHHHLFHTLTQPIVTTNPSVNAVIQHPVVVYAKFGNNNIYISNRKPKSVNIIMRFVADGRPFIRFKSRDDFKTYVSHPHGIITYCDTNVVDVDVQADVDENGFSVVSPYQYELGARRLASFYHSIRQHTIAIPVPYHQFENASICTFQQCLESMVKGFDSVIARTASWTLYIVCLDMPLDKADVVIQLRNALNNVTPDLIDLTGPPQVRSDPGFLAASNSSHHDQQALHSVLKRRRHSGAEQRQKGECIIDLSGHTPDNGEVVMREPPAYSTNPSDTTETHLPQTGDDTEPQNSEAVLQSPVLSSSVPFIGETIFTEPRNLTEPHLPYAGAGPEIEMAKQPPVVNRSVQPPSRLSNKSTHTELPLSNYSPGTETGYSRSASQSPVVFRSGSNPGKFVTTQVITATKHKIKHNVVTDDVSELAIDTSGDVLMTGHLMSSQDAAIFLHLVGDDIEHIHRQKINDDQVKLFAIKDGAGEHMDGLLDSFKSEYFKCIKGNPFKNSLKIHGNITAYFLDNYKEVPSLVLPRNEGYQVFALNYNDLTRAMHASKVLAGLKVLSASRSPPSSESTGRTGQASVRPPYSGPTFYSMGKHHITVNLGDITKVPLDAIVNAANGKLHNYGGVAYAISRAGGRKFDMACVDYVSKHGQIAEGNVGFTIGGDLPVKYVIHAVGPMYSDHGNDNAVCHRILAKTIFNALSQAEKLKCTSIAVTSISSAIFGVPKHICADAYVAGTAQFARSGNGILVDIQFLDVNSDMVSAVQTAFAEKWGDYSKGVSANVQMQSSTVSNETNSPQNRGSRNSGGARPKTTPAPPPPPRRDTVIQGSGQEQHGPQTKINQRHTNVALSNISVSTPPSTPVPEIFSAQEGIDHQMQRNIVNVIHPTSSLDTMDSTSEFSSIKSDTGVKVNLHDVLSRWVTPLDSGRVYLLPWEYQFLSGYGELPKHEIVQYGHIVLHVFNNIKHSDNGSFVFKGHGRVNHGLITNFLGKYGHGLGLDYERKQAEGLRYHTALTRNIASRFKFNCDDYGLYNSSIIVYARGLVDLYKENPANSRKQREIEKFIRAHCYKKDPYQHLAHIHSSLSPRLPEFFIPIVTRANLKKGRNHFSVDDVSVNQVPCEYEESWNKFSDSFSKLSEKESRFPSNVSSPNRVPFTIDPECKLLHAYPAVVGNARIPVICEPASPNAIMTFKLKGIRTPLSVSTAKITLFTDREHYFSLSAGDIEKENCPGGVFRLYVDKACLPQKDIKVKYECGGDSVNGSFDLQECIHGYRLSGELSKDRAFYVQVSVTEDSSPRFKPHGGSDTDVSRKSSGSNVSSGFSRKSTRSSKTPVSKPTEPFPQPPTVSPLTVVNSSASPRAASGRLNAEVASFIPQKISPTPEAVFVDLDQLSYALDQTKVDSRPAHDVHPNDYYCRYTAAKENFSDLYTLAFEHDVPMRGDLYITVGEANAFFMRRRTDISISVLHTACNYVTSLYDFLNSYANFSSEYLDSEDGSIGMSGSQYETSESDGDRGGSRNSGKSGSNGSERRSRNTSRGSKRKAPPPVAGKIEAAPQEPSGVAPYTQTSTKIYIPVQKPQVKSPFADPGVVTENKGGVNPQKSPFGRDDSSSIQLFAKPGLDVIATTKPNSFPNTVITLFQQPCADSIANADKSPIAKHLRNPDLSVNELFQTSSGSYIFVFTDIYDAANRVYGELHVQKNLVFKLRTHQDVTKSWATLAKSLYDITRPRNDFMTINLFTEREISPEDIKRCFDGYYNDAAGQICHSDYDTPVDSAFLAGRGRGGWPQSQLPRQTTTFSRSRSPYKPPNYRGRGGGYRGTGGRGFSARGMGRGYFPFLILAVICSMSVAYELNGEGTFHFSNWEAYECMGNRFIFTLDSVPDGVENVIVQHKDADSDGVARDLRCQAIKNQQKCLDYDGNLYRPSELKKLLNIFPISSSTANFLGAHCTRSTPQLFQCDLGHRVKVNIPVVIREKGKKLVSWSKTCQLKPNRIHGDNSHHHNGEIKDSKLTLYFDQRNSVIQDTGLDGLRNKNFSATLERKVKIDSHVCEDKQGTAEGKACVYDISEHIWTDKISGTVVECYQYDLDCINHFFILQHGDNCPMLVSNCDLSRSRDNLFYLWDGEVKSINKTTHQPSQSQLCKIGSLPMLDGGKCNTSGVHLRDYAHIITPEPYYHTETNDKGGQQNVIFFQNHSKRTCRTVDGCLRCTQELSTGKVFDSVSCGDKVKKDVCHRESIALSDWLVADRDDGVSWLKFWCSDGGVLYVNNIERATEAVRKYMPSVDLKNEQWVISDISTLMHWFTIWLHPFYNIKDRVCEFNFGLGLENITNWYHDLCPGSVEPIHVTIFSAYRVCKEEINGTVTCHHPNFNHSRPIVQFHDNQPPTEVSTPGDVVKVILSGGVNASLTLFLPIDANLYGHDGYAEIKPDNYAYFGPVGTCYSTSWPKATEYIIEHNAKTVMGIEYFRLLDNNGQEYECYRGSGSRFYSFLTESLNYGAVDILFYAILLAVLCVVLSIIQKMFSRYMENSVARSIGNFLLCFFVTVIILSFRWSTLIAFVTVIFTHTLVIINECDFSQRYIPPVSGSGWLLRLIMFIFETFIIWWCFSSYLPVFFAICATVFLCYHLYRRHWRDIWMEEYVFLSQDDIRHYYHTIPHSEIVNGPEKMYQYGFNMLKRAQSEPTLMNDARRTLFHASILRYYSNLQRFSGGITWHISTELAPRLESGTKGTPQTKIVTSHIKEGWSEEEVPSFRPQKKISLEGVISLSFASRNKTTDINRQCYVVQNTTLNNRLVMHVNGELASIPRHFFTQFGAGATEANYMEIWDNIDYHLESVDIFTADHQETVEIQGLNRKASNPGSCVWFFDVTVHGVKFPHGDAVAGHAEIHVARSDGGNNVTHRVSDSSISSSGVHFANTIAGDCGSPIIQYFDKVAHIVGYHILFMKDRRCSGVFEGQTTSFNIFVGSDGMALNVGGKPDVIPFSCNHDICGPFFRSSFLYYGLLLYFDHYEKNEPWDTSYTPEKTSWRSYECGMPDSDWGVIFSHICDVLNRSGKRVVQAHVERILFGWLRFVKTHGYKNIPDSSVLGVVDMFKCRYYHFEELYTNFTHHCNNDNYLSFVLEGAYTGIGPGQSHDLLFSWSGRLGWLDSILIRSVATLIMLVYLYLQPENYVQTLFGTNRLDNIPIWVPKPFHYKIISLIYYAFTIWTIPLCHLGEFAALSLVHCLIVFFCSIFNSLFFRATKDSLVSILYHGISWSRLEYTHIFLLIFQLTLAAFYSYAAWRHFWFDWYPLQYIICIFGYFCKPNVVWIIWNVFTLLYIFSPLILTIFLRLIYLIYEIVIYQKSIGSHVSLESGVDEDKGDIYHQTIVKLICRLRSIMDSLGVFNDCEEFVVICRFCSNINADTRTEVVFDHLATLREIVHAKFPGLIDSYLKTVICEDSDPGAILYSKYYTTLESDSDSITSQNKLFDLATTLADVGLATVIPAEILDVKCRNKIANRLQQKFRIDARGYHHSYDLLRLISQAYPAESEPGMILRCLQETSQNKAQAIFRFCASRAQASNSENAAIWLDLFNRQCHQAVMQEQHYHLDSRTIYNILRGIWRKYSIKLESADEISADEHDILRAIHVLQEDLGNTDDGKVKKALNVELNQRFKELSDVKKRNNVRRQQEFETAAKQRRYQEQEEKVVSQVQIKAISSNAVRKAKESIITRLAIALYYLEQLTGDSHSFSTLKREMSEKLSDEGFEFWKYVLKSERDGIDCNQTEDTVELTNPLQTPSLKRVCHLGRVTRVVVSAFSTDAVFPPCYEVREINGVYDPKQIWDLYKAGSKIKTVTLHRPRTQDYLHSSHFLEYQNTSSPTISLCCGTSIQCTLSHNHSSLSCLGNIKSQFFTHTSIGQHNDACSGCFQDVAKRQLKHGRCGKVFRGTSEAFGIYFERYYIDTLTCQRCTSCSKCGGVSRREGGFSCQSDQWHGVKCKVRSCDDEVCELDHGPDTTCVLESYNVTLKDFRPDQLVFDYNPATNACRVLFQEQCLVHVGSGAPSGFNKLAKGVSQELRTSEDVYVNPSVWKSGKYIVIMKYLKSCLPEGSIAVLPVLSCTCGCYTGGMLDDHMDHMIVIDGQTVMASQVADRLYYHGLISPSKYSRYIHSPSHGCFSCDGKPEQYYSQKPTAPGLLYFGRNDCLCSPNTCDSNSGQTHYSTCYFSPGKKHAEWYGLPADWPLALQRIFLSTFRFNRKCAICRGALLKDNDCAFCMVSKVVDKTIKDNPVDPEFDQASSGVGSAASSDKEDILETLHQAASNPSCASQVADIFKLLEAIQTKLNTPSPASQTPADDNTSKNSLRRRQMNQGGGNQNECI